MPHPTFSDFFNLIAENSEDVAELRKVFQSPYFTNSPSKLKLIKVVEKDPSLLVGENRERLFRKIFPRGRKFNSNELSKRLSETNVFVKRFFCSEQLKKTEEVATNYHLLAKTAAYHGNYSMLVNIYDDFYKTLNDQPYRGSQFYEEEWKINKNIYYNPEHPKHLANDSRLERTMESLDRMYVLNKLEQAIELYNNQIFSKQKLKGRLWEEVFALAREYGKEQKIFQLYVDLIELLRKPPLNEQQFTQLLQDYYLLMPAFTPAENRKLLVVIINYANKLLNKGHTEQYRTIFTLYQKADENNLLVYRKRITAYTFLNIITVATELGEVAYAKRFIQKYTPCLPPKTADSIKKLTEALLAFGAKEYNSAITKAVDTKNEAFPNRIIADLLVIRCMFMQGIDQGTVGGMLTKYLENFRGFASRTIHLSDSKRETYLNFCRIFNRLLTAFSEQATEKRHKRLDKLTEDINNCEQLVARHWLLVVIDRLYYS